MNKSYRMNEFDEIIFNEINKLVLDPDYLKAIKSDHNQKEEVVQIKAIEKQIQQLDNQISRFMDLYGIGRFSIEQLDEKTTPLMDQKDKLHQELERLKIISCSSSKLSSHFSKYITFIETNFECYGSAALEIAKISSANPYISEINITINWDAYGVPLPKFTSSESEPVQLDKFYEDTEIQNFLKLDTLLCLCDKLDIKIIKLLMNGHSYDEVSDRLFMAKETVKYRSKKYFRICKVNTKSEFIKFIKEFHQFFEEDNL